ncbi:uncharacterized protein LOC124794686 isoform X1 [Schistocerca piceifrons]|uniref:uncharacterized protein LOC124794686 isoform X1 n=1 Tax=Schistocerca piceifrons TaxID=274613 RepID=UPI001F5EA0C4|nr:uncharacterized protein LOC124794686 isoform X1 [Schistocerca piceifrons]
MLTRREKLLIRPWQQRRYNNHRRKVQSALPAIDSSPPPTRQHVCCKLKKLQWEEERCARIEEDNFRLLQRMGHIMRTNRLDNHWTKTPPNFLHRVGIYYQPTKKETFGESIPSSAPNGSRKNVRCQACSTEKKYERKITPETPLAWEVRNTDFAKPLKPERARSETRKKHRRNQERKINILEENSSQLMVTRGPLHLSVNFPPNTTVRFHNSQQNKILQKEFCECKSIKKST